MFQPELNGWEDARAGEADHKPCDTNELQLFEGSGMGLALART